ncbi:unnamed protein product [Angiostrongylus costaricensis]|uniref:MARVEL domain-containing protein n=1 Tax=Angiostrongylus costaricensis TaxID=334426 RepID=A0A0R3PB74_ANGCS|nr:unnamed protein product [Angiostrongylus costaricensis]
MPGGVTDGYKTLCLVTCPMARMVSLLIVVVFLIDGRIQWKAYSVIYALAFILIFGCTITLFLHYFEVQKIANQLPWIKLELFWNAISFVLCALGSAVLIWDWVQMRSGYLLHHSALTPHNIGEQSWQRRVLIVAVSGKSHLTLTSPFLFKS